MCESHDIQSFQFAMRNKQGLQQRDIDREVSLLSEAAQIIAINRFEKQFLDRLIPPEKVVFIPQPILDPPATIENLAGAANLAELIEACGPFHLSVRRDDAGALPHASPLRRLRLASSIDLLYVSSRHEANLEGIRLFLSNIYFPMLEPLGINLVIAGEVCEDMRELNHPNIYLVYRLKKLAPIYAAAKIVVLPIFAGAGSPIKTLEALGRGKPIVATTFALRGIRFDAAKFPTFDDWEGFGGRVVDLVDNRDLRAIASKQSLDLSRENGNDGLYGDRLNAVVRAAIGPNARADVGRKECAAAETSAIEWVPKFGDYNGLLREWLSDGCFTETALRAFQDDPLELSKAETMFRALLSNSDAPGRVIAGNADFPLLNGERISERFKAFWAGVTNGDRDHDPLSRAAEHELRFHVAGGVEATIGVEMESGLQRPVWRSQAPEIGATRVADGVRALPKQEGTITLVQRFRQKQAPPRRGDPLSHWEGFHNSESLGALGRVARWTGPELDASVNLAIKSHCDTVVSVEVLETVASRIFETAVMSVNGVRLPTLKYENGRKLIALAPARFLAKKIGRIRLGLHVVETLAPEPCHDGTRDTRKLGLRIGDIVTETLLSRNDARPTASPFVQAVIDMIERGPRAFVFACYRDLLMRDPDSGGYEHYVSNVIEGRQPRGVLEDLLLSPEFKEKFDVPEYGQIIYQHLLAFNLFPPEESSCA